MGMDRAAGIFPNFVLTLPTLLALAVVVLFVMTALLQWLWNITITRIFGVREITYWEAFRLIIIAGILFGGGSGFRINF